MDKIINKVKGYFKRKPKGLAKYSTEEITEALKARQNTDNKTKQLKNKITSLEKKVKELDGLRSYLKHEIKITRIQLKEHTSESIQTDNYPLQDKDKQITIIDKGKEIKPITKVKPIITNKVIDKVKPIVKDNNINKGKFKKLSSEELKKLPKVNYKDLNTDTNKDHIQTLSEKEFNSYFSNRMATEKEKWTTAIENKEKQKQKETEQLNKAIGKIPTPQEKAPTA